MDTEPHPNYNDVFTKILEQIGMNEKNMGNGVKHKAYMKAVTALQMHPSKITSGKEAMEIDGIGKKISAKIDEIIKTGTLKKLEEMNADPRQQAVNQLTKVSGIGPVMALKMYDEHGIKEIEDLEKVKDQLNHHQLIGFTFYKEFIQRIPRDEVSEIEQLIKKEAESIDPLLSITTCGSFRRQKPTCGDIDILVTHPDYSSSDQTPPFLKKLVDRLKSLKLVTDILSLGDKQFHGVVQLPKPNALHRRLDILWITREQFHFGLLYFTGSGFFNIQMRRIALERGFTLNEFEILPIGTTGVCGEPILVSSERDIFDMLGMEWKEPHERDLAPDWKPTMS